MECDRIIKPPESKTLKSGRVRLAPGEEVGEHVTEKREELIVILKGSARLEKEGARINLQQGETHYIPEGTKHNIKNDSDKELEYIYIVSLFEGSPAQKT